MIGAIFFTLVTLGSGALGIWIWRASPAQFDRFNKRIQQGAYVYQADITRGIFRAIAPFTAGMFSFAYLVVMKGILESRSDNSAHYDLYFRSALVAALLGIIFFVLTWVVIWFNRPRWLVPPNMRHEKSIWDVRYGRRRRR